MNITNWPMFIYVPELAPTYPRDKEVDYLRLARAQAKRDRRELRRVMDTAKTQYGKWVTQWINAKYHNGDPFDMPDFVDFLERVREQYEQEKLLRPLGT